VIIGKAAEVAEMAGLTSVAGWLLCGQVKSSRKGKKVCPTPPTSSSPDCHPTALVSLDAHVSRGQVGIVSLSCDCRAEHNWMDSVCSKSVTYSTKMLGSLQLPMVGPHWPIWEKRPNMAVSWCTSPFSTSSTWMNMIKSINSISFQLPLQSGQYSILQCR
jgi:hypothetical protein